MAIELSNLTFTEQDDIVPASGVEEILNTGIANTLAGDDIITGTGSNYGFENLGVLNTDDGNDTITGNGGLGDWGFGIYNLGPINTDDGNDIITGTGRLGIYNGYIGSIDTGKGNDTITGNGDNTGIFNPHPGRIIDTGDGNDIITGTGEFGIGNSGIIDTGNGNDVITGTSTGNGSAISQFPSGIINTGDGNDVITATDGNDSDLRNWGFIGTGDGDDLITSSAIIYNEGVIETGNGDDSIIVDGGVDENGNRYSIKNNGGAINMGDGNDIIIANEGFESGPNSSGAWFLGEGEDYIKGFGNGDFYGGNGNDTLELTSGTYTVGIWGGGNESPIFTKGNQLMITSEFEKLKAGNIIYDFTSLTAGQIIVVA